MVAEFRHITLHILGDTDAHYQAIHAECTIRAIVCWSVDFSNNGIHN